MARSSTAYDLGKLVVCFDMRGLQSFFDHLDASFFPLRFQGPSVEEAVRRVCGDPEEPPPPNKPAKRLEIKCACTHSRAHLPPKIFALDLPLRMKAVDLL